MVVVWMDLLSKYWLISAIMTISAAKTVFCFMCLFPIIFLCSLFFFPTVCSDGSVVFADNSMTLLCIICLWGWLSFCVVDLLILLFINCPSQSYLPYHQGRSDLLFFILLYHLTKNTVIGHRFHPASLWSDYLLHLNTRCRNTIQYSYSGSAWCLFEFVTERQIHLSIYLTYLVE